MSHLGQGICYFFFLNFPFIYFLQTRIKYRPHVILFISVLLHKIMWVKKRITITHDYNVVYNIVKRSRDLEILYIQIFFFLISKFADKEI